MNTNSSSFHTNIISDSTLWIVPTRWTRKNIVVLKFGGTTAGSSPEEGRIKLARKTIADLIEQGKSVVPVFSAYRRGRSQSSSKTSVTDILQNYKKRVLASDNFWDGINTLHQQLHEVHFGLIEDLQLRDNRSLCKQITQDLDIIKATAAQSCNAYEPVPSLDDYLVTAGERLVVRIMAAYFSKLHAEGKFPMRAEPVTALELGIATNNNFGSADIDWPVAVENAREVIFGKYIEQNIMPVVTGFDGIYDPHDEFKSAMREAKIGTSVGNRFYRTSLGRGGSDLTATFLGLALDAEYVGFCKETPGVLTADDKLVGDRARSIPNLDYDLATEAGNIYSRAVEPVRAGSVPVHIFDPIDPNTRTVISEATLAPGIYIVDRPQQTVNIQIGSIPDEPGELNRLLDVFAQNKVNVEEVRHQRSGTDFIVLGEESDIQNSMQTFSEMGLRLGSQFTWYFRAIGNVTEELAAAFNAYMIKYEPLSLATYQMHTRVLTATISRNRAVESSEEIRRVEDIVTRLHDDLVTDAGTPEPLAAVTI